MTSVDLTEPAEDSPAKKCGSCGGVPVRCWCVDCDEALCHDCMSAHRRVTVTRSHKLLDQAPPEVRSITPTKFCSLHPSETLQLFCFRCNQMTCRDCQLVAHKNHSFEFISKAVESLKKQLGSSVDPLQEQMRASRRSIVEMEERLADLSQHETFIKTKLQKNFSALAEFLSRRLEKVLKEVQKVHDWERQKIRQRMLKVKQLQQSCMALTAAADQAQNVSDLLELLGCMAQIKPQVKDLISRDSAPPKTMACLKVITDQQSLDSILQFGKIEVSWVPFSTYQAPKKDTSSLHEVAPPTFSFKRIAPRTSSSLSGIAPPTSSSSFNGIAPPTFSFKSIAPPTSSSSFSGIAPPTSFSFFNGSAPPTSSSLSGIAPPTSSSSFNGSAPPTSSSLSGIAPPTSSSSFSGIAPPTSSSSFSGIAPPTSSSSFSGIAPPSSSTCSSFSSQTPPPLVSHSSAPSLLSLSSWRHSTYAPPVHTADAPPAPPPIPPVLPLIAPPDPKKAKRADSVCSSQLPPPSAPLPAQTHPTPTLSVNYPAPPPTSLDPLGVTPPQTTAAAASKVRINVISRSEVAALSRLLEWPQKHHDPPKKKPARSSVPQGGRSADASSRKHPPKKTKSSGGASTLLFHSLAPQSKNLTTSSLPPCSPPIMPAVTPDPPPQQQPSVFAPGGLAASKPTAPSLPSPPPSPPPSKRGLTEPLVPPPPYPQIPLKDQEPPHTLHRGSASLQPGSFVSPPRPETPPPPHPSLRDRPPSLEEPSPHSGSCRRGTGCSSPAEPSEPEAELAFPVEPEPPEEPAPPPAAQEPTPAPCGGPDPDRTPVRKLGAGTRGGGAPRGGDSRLLQPRVSLFRLPVSWSGPGRPPPRFQLILGDAEDQIYMQEISQVETSRPKDSCRSSTDDRALNDQNPDFLEPLSLEILSCSTCGASDASKICISCGRGYHRDCHVPPVRPDIWSALTCSLCQDLSDPTDPFSSDRPACPQTSGLGLLDQRKCETLVLHLLVEGCGRLSESGFLLDLTRISERLTCQRLPGFQRAEELVSELWTLMEESQSDALSDLQESFQNKVKETFGSEFLPLLRRTSNSKAPPAGGSCSPKCDASGPKDVDSELQKVRRDGQRTDQGSKLEVMRRRLRDFLDRKKDAD